MNVFLKLALLICFALLGARVAHRFNLPNVTGYLIGGLFLGPSFLALISSADQVMINFVNEIALAAIAFNIGGEFLMKDFKKLGKEIFIITVFEVFAVVLLVFLVMFYGFKQNFVFSLIVASMSAATAPAGTMMVIQQYRAKGPLTNTILPVAALDDALGIMVFGVSLSFVKMTLSNQGGFRIGMLFAPILEIVLSLLLGFVLGFILSRLSKYAKTQEELLSMILFFILMSTGLSMYFGLSSLLSGMMIGGMYVNLSHHPSRVFSTLNQFVPPFNVLFFAMAGASLDLSVLSKISGLGIAYVFSRGIGKVLGATLGAKIAKSKDTIVKYLGLALLPQGGISIGLSMTVSKDLPQYSEGIVTLILFSVLVFEILGPILAKFALSKAGELST